MGETIGRDLNGLRAARASDHLGEHDAIADGNRNDAELSLSVGHPTARRALHGHHDIG